MNVKCPSWHFSNYLKIMESEENRSSSVSIFCNLFWCQINIEYSLYPANYFTLQIILVFENSYRCKTKLLSLEKSNEIYSQSVKNY